MCRVTLVRHITSTQYPGNLDNPNKSLIHTPTKLNILHPMPSYTGTRDSGTRNQTIMNYHNQKIQ